MKGCLLGVVALLLFLSVPGLSAAGEYEDAVASSGPIAYWALEENADGILYDSMGNAPDLLSSEIPEFIDTGRYISDALKFDGANLLSLEAEAPVVSGNFSIELWVRLDELADFQILLQHGNSNKRSPFSLFISDWGFGEPEWHLEFDVFAGEDEDGINLVNVSDSNPIELGKLYHIVVTYDGSTLNLYRNGEFADSTAYSGGIKPSSEPYYIGGLPGDGARDAVTGTIGDIAIYSQVISPEDIANHAQIGMQLADSSLVVINDNTHILASDANYDGKNIQVESAILTIDGFHSFSSLKLSNNSVLSHSLDSTESLVLDVSGVVEIDSTSKIDVSALGELSIESECPGCGGSYASNGGGSLDPGFGDVRKPLAFGKGGSSTVEGGRGTRGGGRIHIKASSIILDGTITANGQDAFSSELGEAGAGSGGSIFIEAQNIEGRGSVSVNGGKSVNEYDNSDPTYGGSGGRLAIYTSDEVDWSVSAKGGSKGGGPGTIFLRVFKTLCQPYSLIG